MKARIIETISEWDGGELRIPKGGWVLKDPDNTQRVEPVRFVSFYERETGSTEYDDEQIWLFRNRVVRVDEPHTVSAGEILLAVKHVVLSQERAFDEMKSDVDRFAQYERASGAPRDSIPREVRIFVWRRDQGHCVQCGGDQELEFDHIIPLVKGGSNTERNIQLLCRKCNSAKAASI